MWKTSKCDPSSSLSVASRVASCKLQVADTNLCHVQRFDNRFAQPSMQRPLTPCWSGSGGWGRKLDMANKLISAIIGCGPRRVNCRSTPCSLLLVPFAWHALTFAHKFSWKAEEQRDRGTDRQIEKQTDRQRDRGTGRRTNVSIVCVNTLCASASASSFTACSLLSFVQLSAAATTNLFF